MKLGLVALLMVLGFTGVAQAQDFGIIAGIRSDSADTDVAGASLNSMTDWQFGGIAKFDVAPVLQIRSGLTYLQRSYESKSGGVSTDLKFTYVEVPVGLLWKFSDFGGAFIGPAFDMNVSKDCGGGSSSCSGVSSLLTPIQLGGSFKFAPNFGLEFYFETVPGKLADGVKDAKAVALNLMITFD